MPPVWIMRQAGRYLPEYRRIRARERRFLDLCYSPDLATEISLQPIRRYGLDAAILFADILLLPHALGCKLDFPEGHGPRLSPVRTQGDIDALAPAAAIHNHLAPVYRTIENLRRDLPPATALIGFAGAPWTVATYMIAGRGTPGQEPAHMLIREDQRLFDRLIDHLTDATILYLSEQARAGAEVLKLFDSWAGSLTRSTALFDRYCSRVHRRIFKALRRNFPAVPLIGFPRGAGRRYASYVASTGVDCIALGTDIDATEAARDLQPRACVQGNLDPKFLVSGGAPLIAETRRIVAAFAGGAHVFNLGHGITPDADPDNVRRMIDTIRR